ncbi:hypothetical protein M427DRAFT_58081 [Gonapodya prolifera JEL478]|uniref:Crinkler effector protein N-terminal domain-containing protein n=1 Tax=Gonapodya prolifera (strain JEL478) TaxID=1344416 RepID=A0A139AAZ2_GONPJ|nr:hypothetical protein M427DRAFT_58081 [Gonapodya prolifera JEL478]|eukprot:KXS13829.1 hypothetical protein M427DRAFT_58081 [Gonapodya prolifera JEL478]
MAGAEVTLGCLLLGEKRPFVVRMDLSATPPPIVNDLKNRIKTELSQMLSGIDAAQLDVWQVNVPYAARATIREDAFKEEDAMEPLKKVKFYVLTPPEEERIHIVVRRPSVPSTANVSQTPAPAWAQNLYLDLWLQRRPLLEGDLSVEVPCLGGEETTSLTHTFTSIDMSNSVFQSFQNIFGLKRFLVREEYRLALRFIDLAEQKWKAKQSKRAPTFANCGNPGKGKSLFLYYVLAIRLSQRKPTAFQETKNNFVYFQSTGVTLHGAWDEFTPADGTWALSDSQEDVEPPCRAFVREPRLIIVQATSPKEDRYKEWIKQTDGVVYWMNPWTWPEMWFVGYVCFFSGF